MRIKRIGVSAFVFSNIDRLQAPYCRLLSRQSRRSIAVRVGLKKSWMSLTSTSKTAADRPKKNMILLKRAERKLLRKG